MTNIYIKHKTAFTGIVCNATFLAVSCLSPHKVPNCKW